MFEDKSLTERKRPIRVLSLLDSLARAALAPAPLRVVHEVAYLSNVLAPVFDLTPFSSSLLKRRGGPYYPSLQNTIDQLVGHGLVVAERLRYVHVPEESRYRLDATYRLNPDFASNALTRYREVYSDTREIQFLDELAAAYSMLTDDEMGHVTMKDARYEYTDVDVNNVIDFGEWLPSAKVNFSRNAALSFAPDVGLLPAERLYLYLDHLRHRAASGG